MGAVHRLFVYGSLMEPGSRRATLAHRDGPAPAAVAVLDGWARAWNCLSARTFEVAGGPPGTVHRRLVLGLVRREGARCQGLILEVTDDDLRALAEREAAYHLVDVTVGLARPAEAGAVRAFVPRPRRTRDQVAVAEPLVVERSYLDRCRAGAAAHGLGAAARELQDALGPLPVVDPR